MTERRLRGGREADGRCTERSSRCSAPRAPARRRAGAGSLAAAALLHGLALALVAAPPPPRAAAGAARVRAGADHPGPGPGRPPRPRRRSPRSPRRPRPPQRHRPPRSRSPSRRHRRPRSPSPRRRRRSRAPRTCRCCRAPRRSRRSPRGRRRRSPRRRRSRSPPGRRCPAAARPRLPRSAPAPPAAAPRGRRTAPAAAPPPAAASAPRPSAPRSTGLDNPNFTYGYYIDRLLSLIDAQWERPTMGERRQGGRLLPHPARRQHHRPPGPRVVRLQCLRPGGPARGAERRAVPAAAVGLQAHVPGRQPDRPLTRDRIRGAMNARAAALPIALLLAGGVALPWTAAQTPAPQAPPAGQTPGQPPAEDDQVTIELNAQPAAADHAWRCPPFARRAALAGAAGRRGARAGGRRCAPDLEASGYFEIQGPAALSVLRLTGEWQQRPASSTARSATRCCCVGDVRAGGGPVVFEGRLFDLAAASRSSPSATAAPSRGAPHRPHLRRRGHPLPDRPAGDLALLDRLHLGPHRAQGDLRAWTTTAANQRRITGHRSTSMSPAWSPDGDALAYTSFFNGPPGIYLADLASGRKRRSSPAARSTPRPTFSPDGSRIAFARSLDGNIEIFTADRDGGDLRRLTHSQRHRHQPGLEPEGGRDRLHLQPRRQPAHLPHGRRGRQPAAADLRRGLQRRRRLEPGGRPVAYTSRRGGRFQIAVTNVVTLETRVLTSGAGENESPTFSPDGRKIAFTSRRSGAQADLRHGRATAATCGSSPAEGNNDMPDWSRMPP